jgi:uncharacterized protein YndB with AHSA1/START domain
MNATTTESTSNSIRKQVQLKAKIGRVWKALTDSKEFGTWFRVTIDGPFEVGRHLRGNVTYPGYEHLKVDWIVERMDEPRLFSYRWHPYPSDPNKDYSKEPMTLVEFRLEEAGDGTLLTVTESGFDRIPASRRAEAFRMNSGGWEGQMENIKKHVEK